MSLIDSRKIQDGNFIFHPIPGQNQRDFDCNFVRTTTWAVNETFPPDWTDDTTESSDRRFWTVESTPETTETEIVTQDITLSTEGREGKELVTIDYHQVCLVFIFSCTFLSFQHRI